MEAIGQDVVCHTTGTGTHTGAWLDIKPTGQTVTMTSVAVWRFNDEGKVLQTLAHERPAEVEQQVESGEVSGYGAYWRLRPDLFTPG